MKITGLFQAFHNTTGYRQATKKTKQKEKRNKLSLFRLIVDDVVQFNESKERKENFSSLI